MCGTKICVQLPSSGSFQPYFEVLVDFFLMEVLYYKSKFVEEEAAIRLWKYLKIEMKCWGCS